MGIYGYFKFYRSMRYGVLHSLRMAWRLAR